MRERIEVNVKFQVNKEIKKYGEKFGFVSTNAFQYLKSIIKGRKEDYISNYNEEESQENLLIGLLPLTKTQTTYNNGTLGVIQSKPLLYQLFEKKQLTQEPSATNSSSTPLFLLIEVGELKATNNNNKKQKYEVQILRPSKFFLSRVILQATDLSSLALFKQESAEKIIRNTITNNGNGRLIGWGDKIEIENEDRKKFTYSVIRTSPIRNGFITPQMTYHLTVPTSIPSPSHSSTLIFILPPHPTPSDHLIDTLSIEHKVDDFEHHHHHRDEDIGIKQSVEITESPKSKLNYDSSLISHRILNFGLSNSLISPISHRHLTAHLLTSPLPSHLLYSPPSNSFPLSDHQHTIERRANDKSREVYVTLQTLKYLQISNGSFVSIHLSSLSYSLLDQHKEEESDGRYSKGYIVQLFALKTSHSSRSSSPFIQFYDNILYIPSPIAHRFQLTRFQFQSSLSHPPLLPYHFIIKLLPIPSLQNNSSNENYFSDAHSNSNGDSSKDKNDHKKYKEDEGIKKGFPKIKEISISLIRNKQMERNSIPKQFFLDYFSNVKLISKGDVISVPVRKLKYFALSDNSPDTENEYLELLSSASLLDPSSVIHQSVFFLVNDIKLSYDHLTHQNNSFAHWKVVNNLEDTGYYDLSSSALYQSSSVHSSLPFSIDSFLSPSPSSISFSEINTITEEMITMIAPHLFSQQLPQSKYKSKFSILTYGARGSGKRKIAYSISKLLGVHFIQVNCYELIGSNDLQTADALRACFDEAHYISPCILLLRHLSALEKTSSVNRKDSPSAVCTTLRSLIQNNQNKHEQEVVVIATDHKLDNSSSQLRSCFLHEIPIDAPDEPQRRSLIRSLFSSKSLSSSSSSSPHPFEKMIASKTAGFAPSDIQSLISRSSALTFSRFLSSDLSSLPHRLLFRFSDDEIIFTGGIEESEDDLEKCIDQLQRSQAEGLGTPNIPNVQWDDVGGLISAKKDILDTIQLPLEHPQLFKNGLRQRSGVLLYGPPGTGKTLLAKAVATECALNFMSVKGPELLNMYVGESEKNVRDIFEKARNAKPCVIFFDELDSVAPNRGHGSDSGGVMDRVVSSLLSELDGLSKASDVFVIGATNRPDLLDPALLRPGRLDKLIYLGVCETVPSRLQIIKALTRKFDLADNLDLEKIASCCPVTFTGADLYALCADAMMIAVRSHIDEFEKLSSTNSKESKEMIQKMIIKINEDHFMEALNGISPSVSESELQHYRQVQQQFSQPK